MKAYQLLLLLLLLSIRPALAQSSVHSPATPSFARVYTYVEQMPQLSSDGGNAAIAQAIMRNLRVSRGNDGGSAVVEFVVTPTGVISAVQLRRATSTALGAAVVAATQQLPRLVPGRQAGQRVPVRMVIPFSCIKTQ